MRQIVRAALPLGDGIILDPFMGGGSTIAAAIVLGYRSIGIEYDPEFFAMATLAIPQLADIVTLGEQSKQMIRSSHESANDQYKLFS